MHQQKFQSLVAGAGLETDHAVTLQQSFQGEQVLLEIVHKQEMDRLLRASHACPRPFRTSGMRASDITCAAGQARRAASGIGRA
ncbi:hypothetical protein D3C72_743720 [compost metagenome]